MKISVMIPSIKSIRESIDKKMDQTIDVIYNNVQELVDGTPLTKKQRLSHPYSRASKKSNSIVVHVQSGNLKKALKRTNSGITVDSSIAPYFYYVIKGTKKMVPRPFIQAAIGKSLPEIRKIWRT